MRKPRSAKPTAPTAAPATTAPLFITDIDHQGRGVGRDNGKAVFVEGALPGETVLWQPLRYSERFTEARLQRCLNASPLRREPPCEYAASCGGCAWQHIDDSAQVALKSRVFEAQLKRLGKVFPEEMLPPIYGLPSHYRERVRLTVQHNSNRTVLGFQAASSHDVADIGHCRVLSPRLSAAIAPVKALLQHTAQHSGIHHLIMNEGENAAALCLEAAVPYRCLKPQERQAWEQLVQTLTAQSGLGWQLWWANKNTPHPTAPVYTTDATAALSYRLPEYGIEIAFTPHDFTQVNRRTNALMVHRALTWLRPQAGERIIDWFCGLGNFSLPLARSGADVVGVEGVDTMVRKAAANAETNGLAARTLFVCANLFAVTARDVAALGRSDTWLLDPPRAGAQTLLKTLPMLPEHARPQRIVYISCNPATFARDAAVIAADGYRFRAAGLMNWFAQTAHMEAVGVFERVC